MAEIDRYGHPLTLMDAGHTSFVYARAFGRELQRDIETVTGSPVVDGIMKVVGGLFAVLNRSKQVLAVNDSFFRSTGLRNSAAVLGLRIGDAISCEFAAGAPDGCGSGPQCTTCGQAIATTLSLALGSTEERKCAIRLRRDGATSDVCFLVRSTPCDIGGRTFLMVLLRDITEDEQHAEIERVFFDEVAQAAAAMQEAMRTGAMELLARHARRVAREVELRRGLASFDSGSTTTPPRDVTAAEIVSGLREMYAGSRLAEGKTFTLPQNLPEAVVGTDEGALLRVLSNMLNNAFEAAGDEVRLAFEISGANAVFSVWNPEPIPPDIMHRVFQRHFSTKQGGGRGVGCYMMKHLAERVLRGTVSFSSSPEGGTTFRLSLPFDGEAVRPDEQAPPSAAGLPLSCRGERHPPSSAAGSGSR